MARPKPVALIILDGFGLRNDVTGNAVAQANKPNYDRYWNHYPHTTLTAAGEAVGLPDGQMGNSEVGHLNIGAGRIVYQDLTRITKSIKDGDFYDNEALLRAVNGAKFNDKKLHIFGLLSDGGVHSHIDHMFALLELAKRQGVDEVFVHAFLDGRDVAPDSAVGFMKQLLAKMNEIGIGKVASVHGRYYAMDRDKRWDRVEKTYRVLCYGEGNQTTDPVAAIESSYANNVMDEFFVPTVVANPTNGEPTALIGLGDSIIFANFRPDRAIQLAQVFAQEGFNAFDKGEQGPMYTQFVCMTTYTDTINAEVAFGPKDLTNTLGEVIADAGLKQLRTAETEKYPHVTFFFSGGRDLQLEGETRILVNSPKVATYDLQPEMSAYEVADRAVDEIMNERQDAIILNFANPDMVGHSGMLEPTIKAVEATDDCLGKVVEAVLSKGGVAIITADHGNADMVIDPEGKPFTAHTTNPVPLIVTSNEVTLREGGILADIAPTMLTLLQLSKPAEMTGNSLI